MKYFPSECQGKLIADGVKSKVSIPRPIDCNYAMWFTDSEL